ncbi:hypothetical protein [Silvanigrella aquatica]|uniref:Uncharacterized protein n=1 Tax=Silvanigrella aquatica TaxID=1915309 RepID=A0A1L4CXF5_9BACT|nr:hypothetical protein [Silvanigrella aquatica]APJ02628.1 hypothetical protein AXG55_01245 [Silvanigrella aquatica]
MKLLNLKFFINLNVAIIINFIFSHNCYSRTMEEIIKSGKLNVAVLKPQKDEFDTNLSIKKNKLIKEYFEKFSSIKLNKRLKLNFIYVNSFANFWENKHNQINTNSSEKPQLFEKVDAYFELLSTSNWRNIKATPINIAKSKFSLICDFDPHYINLNSNEKILQTLKNPSIKFISIKDSYIDRLYKGLKISENKMTYITPKRGLVQGMIDDKGKNCAFSETMNILKFLANGQIYLISFLPGGDNKDLAWWVPKDSSQLHQFISEFHAYLEKSKGLDRIYLTLFGVSYNFYNFIIELSSSQNSYCQ